MKPRIVSLCSGYGGLDLAAEALTGGTTVAHVEYDAAPSKVLAARWPGVPNLGDLTRLAWADLDADVLTAGYPCQPFSGAGKRLGTDDPRHLFPWIAKGVERMRPQLLLLENVRGHLSLGFDIVLAELDRIGYDARWTLLRAADVGACHGRARLWIAARDRQAGGWPVEPGEPTAAVEDGVWVRAQGGLFGSVEADKPGPAGVMVGGARWDRVTAPLPLLLDALLPTPVADHSRGLPQPGTDYASLPNVLVSLLPTPAVNDMGAGKTVEAWDAWTEKVKAKHGNGNGHGPSLHIEAARLACHTADQPRRADDVTHGDAATSAAGQDLPGLRDGVQPPTDRQSVGGSGGIPASADLLAVLREQPNGGDEGRAALASPAAPEAGVRGVRDGEGAARPSRRPRPGEQRPDEPADALRELPSAVALARGSGQPDGVERPSLWGVYAAAIARHERALGRVAPPPTEPGRNGQPRLSPRFVEFMMMLPDGWVVDVLGRNPALKALGNGVVPVQAQAAFSLLLADLPAAVAA